MKSEIEFASHPGNLSLVRDFVRQFLQDAAFDETEKDIMVLGLDEACTNVIRYAYQHQPDQLIVLPASAARIASFSGSAISARSAKRRSSRAARSTSCSPAASAFISSGARLTRWTTT